MLIVQKNENNYNENVIKQQKRLRIVLCGT